MLSNGFTINECDKCVYIKVSYNGFIILCLYVDDMLIMGINSHIINETKNMLKKNFDMKDMDLTDEILGIKIKMNHEGITLIQCHYTEKVLKKFHLFDCELAKTTLEPNVHLSKHTVEPIAQEEYANIIGSLMFITNRKLLSTRSCVCGE